MDRLGIIDKANKCRRPTAYLGNIVELKRLASVKWRWIFGGCCFQDSIELPCYDSLLVLLIDIVNHIKNFCHPLTGQRRNRHGRRKGEKLGPHSQFSHVFFNSMGVFVQKIPFVQQENAATAPFKCIPGNVDILLRNSLFHIQNNQSDITAIQALECFNN